MKKLLERLVLWLFPKTIDRIVNRVLEEERILFHFGSMEAYEQYVREEEERIMLEEALYREHTAEMYEAPDPAEEHEIVPDDYYLEIHPYDDEPERMQDSAFLVDDGKPDVRIGNRVHLHTYRGMYTVYEVRDEGFRIRTQKYTLTQLIPWKDFKCLAGGNWNLFRNEREPKD